MAEADTIARATGRARGRPKLEDGAQIEGHLLDLALKEFLAKGYGGASMAAIIRTAGVSKTTLYSRYGSKEALFRAIMHQQVDRLAAATTLTSASGPMTLEEGLKSYANRTLEISLEGDLLAVNRLINSESHRFPELGMAAVERTELGISQIASFIDECARTGGATCPDSRTFAEGFILLLRGWYGNALLANRTVTPVERRSWVDRMVPAMIAGSSTIAA